MRTCQHCPKDPKCFLCWKSDNDPAYKELFADPVCESLPPSIWNRSEVQSLNYAMSLLPSPEERSRRKSICLACEHYSEGRCKKCGCAAQGIQCPLHKWEIKHLHYYVYPTMHHDAW